MIRPLFDKVLIELENETLHTSGLIMIGEPNERIQRGTVLAVGEGRRENGVRNPLQVKVGDRVLFDKWSMIDIKMQDKVHYIAIEDGIIGILD